MSYRPDPAEVANLQKRFTGLTDDLNYIPGHTIISKYDGYKAAQAAAGTASVAYKTKGNELKAGRPYKPGARATGNIQGRMFYPEGHQVMAPLAGTAANAAGFHANRRESFNTTYEPVLKAKGEYVGHVQEASQARGSQRKYDGYRQAHEARS